jgi:hypothetical protein
MDNSFTPREQVVEVLNRLFYYTDYQDWEGLQKEVFTQMVTLDMTSLGAESAEEVEAVQICAMWKEGFKGLDAIHHQAGTYIITLKGDAAEAKAYARATHYKAAATNGPVREFVGSYDFHLALTEAEAGWRIDYFKFNLKYTSGNIELT